MQLGASMPVGDIGTGPAVMRDYAQAAEGLGFAYLLAPDHVLGANPEPNYGGRRVGTTATAYHDPFVLFGFLAGCTQTDRLCLRRADPGAAPGGAGRQAGGVASTCCAAAMAGSGSASGSAGTRSSSPALNEDFHNRGRRSAEQVRVMQALWAEPHVNLPGEFHHIDDAGINPRPASGRVPIWYGGHAEATFRRAARYGDGFMPLRYPPGDDGARGVRQIARLVARERPRPGGRSGSRSGSRPAPAARTIGAGDRFWKDGRRHPCHRAHHLRQPPPQTHRRPQRRRPSGGDHAVPDRRRGFAVDAEPRAQSEARGAVMKHATSAALAELSELLDRIRTRDGLREKKLECSTENQNPFSTSMRTQRDYLPISLRARVSTATR